MGQHTRLFRLPFLCLALVLAMLTGSCDRAPDSPAASPSTAPSKPTIASVVPAVTDILLEMGLREQIVGISNYDPKTPEREGIARVGDYLSLDWEQLTGIRPAVLVIPRQKQELAGVLQQRADRLGIKLVDVHVDRLEEIFPEIKTLGEVGDAELAAEAMLARIRGQIETVRARVAGRPTVRTLIVLDEAAQFTVGPRNFLDDLLQVAGGQNVGAVLEKDYPRIDKEKLMALNPDAVIQLLPDAPPQVIAAAKRFWQGASELEAVKHGRVYIHTEPYLLLPGPRVAEVAAMMSQDLHPLTAASGATTNNR